MSKATAKSERLAIFLAKEFAGIDKGGKKDSSVLIHDMPPHEVLHF